MTRALCCQRLLVQWRWVRGQQHAANSHVTQRPADCRYFTRTPPPLLTRTFPASPWSRCGRQCTLRCAVIWFLGPMQAYSLKVPSLSTGWWGLTAFVSGREVVRFRFLGGGRWQCLGENFTAVQQDFSRESSANCMHCVTISTATSHAVQFCIVVTDCDHRLDWTTVGLHVSRRLWCRKTSKQKCAPTRVWWPVPVATYWWSGSRIALLNVQDLFGRPVVRNCAIVNAAFSSDEQECPMVIRSLKLS